MSRMKFLLIFCALIPHVYVIIFIRPFTAHKSILHISSHSRGDVIFVNCVLTPAIPFSFGCNCARPVNLGEVGENTEDIWGVGEGGGGGEVGVEARVREGVYMEGEGHSVSAHQPFLGGTYCSIDDEISFFELIC